MNENSKTKQPKNRIYQIRFNKAVTSTLHHYFMKNGVRSIHFDKGEVSMDTGVYTPMSSRLAQLAVLDVIQVAFALKLGAAGSQKLELTKLALASYT